MGKLKEANLERINASSLLKSISIVCVRFVSFLGWVGMRIILVILFYLIFTPLSLIVRLLNIDLLELKKKKDTYWKKKERAVFNPAYYESRF